MNAVRPRENGPLAFHAEAEVAGDGRSHRFTLCRCGQSMRKPYGDNRHVEAGFEATGEPAMQPSDPLAKRDGNIAIAPQRNGPLKVTGNLELVSGTGHTLNRVTETFLSRCGRSGNKPYRDGPHRKIGFKADGV